MDKNTRTRNWTIVVYPDSAPENWLQILNSWNIQYVVSPLHDSDKNGAEEEKKPHFHVLLLLGGVKSFDQIKELVKPLNCPIPQKVHSTKSLVRYFLHLDHPDKFQYKKEQLISYGGVDISDLLRPSSSERYSLMADMISFIDDNEITEFSQIVTYSSKFEKETWFPLLCDSGSYFISLYIKSKHFQTNRKYEPK
jgi:hypothetical protein